MNGFVDYNNRSVQLPPGCKDLIDVLNLTRARRIPRDCDPASEWLPAGAQAECVKTGGLGNIEVGLTRLLTAQLKPSFLVIRAGAVPLHLLCETEAGPLDLYVALQGSDSEQEKAIRAFFSERCIDPLLDYTPAEGWRIIRYPIPCVASRAAALVIALLKGAYLISEDSPLHFVFGRHAGGLW